EKGALEKIPTACPGPAAIDDHQLAVIESRERVAVADDFDVRLGGQRANDAVDIPLPLAARVTKTQIAAAVHQYAYAQAGSGLGCQPRGEGGASVVVFPLKHENIDPAGSPVD